MAEHKLTKLDMVYFVVLDLRCIDLQRFYVKSYIHTFLIHNKGIKHPPLLSERFVYVKQNINSWLSKEYDFGCCKDTQAKYIVA